jgi:hypothetical protein
LVLGRINDAMGNNLPVEKSFPNCEDGSIENWNVQGNQRNNSSPKLKGMQDLYRLYDLYVFCG